MRKETLAVAIGALLIALSGTGSASAQSMAGTYQDRRGGRDSTMTISQGAGGGYRVNIEVGVPRCMGSVTATGRLQGGRLVATAREAGETCTLTIEQRGNALSVSESRCGFFHGASCEFTGLYQRRGR